MGGDTATIKCHELLIHISLSPSLAHSQAARFFLRNVKQTMKVNLIKRRLNPQQKAAEIKGPEIKTGLKRSVLAFGSSTLVSVRFACATSPDDQPAQSSNQSPRQSILTLPSRCHYGSGTNKFVYKQFFSHCLCTPEPSFSQSRVNSVLSRLLNCIFNPKYEYYMFNNSLRITLLSSDSVLIGIQSVQQKRKTISHSRGILKLRKK